MSIEGELRMKDKKFHTLQAKLTLLVGMIVITSLIFFFGNFYLAGMVNREYTTLIEQNHISTARHCSSIRICRMTRDVKQSIQKARKN